jgi:ankyrin repeat protein
MHAGGTDGKAEADAFADQALQLVLTRKNRSGNTPLHWAALNGQAKAAEILAALQHDLGVANSAGQTAYDAAVGAQRTAVAELLVRLAEARVANIDVADLDGEADASDAAEAAGQELGGLTLEEGGEGDVPDADAA